MLKLRVITIVSLLIVAVTVGCTVDSSSTDQAGVIETAVASGLETALAGNVEPTATAAPAATSTPEPVPTGTPTPEPTVVPPPTPEPTATSVPTATPLPAPTSTPTPVLTATNVPWVSPTPVPTSTPVPIDYTIKICRSVAGATLAGVSINDDQPCDEISDIRQMSTWYYFELHASPYFMASSVGFVLTGPETSLGDEYPVEGLEQRGDQIIGSESSKVFIYGTGNFTLTTTVDDEVVASKSFVVEPFDWVNDWAKLPTIDYENLIRTPDAYVGKLFQLSGDVFQVLGYDLGDNKSNRYNIWAGDSTLDQPTYVYSLGQREGIALDWFERLLEDDVVDIVGEFIETKELESLSGSPVQRPKFLIHLMRRTN
jgi:hypothetical protein